MTDQEIEIVKQRIADVFGDEIFIKFPEITQKFVSIIEKQREMKKLLNEIDDLEQEIMELSKTTT